MSVLDLLKRATIGKTKGQLLVELAQSTKPRKDEAALRLAFYHDQQISELLKDLAKQFRQPEKFQLFFINVVKKITNRLAMVYRQPPKREAVDGTERDQQIFSQIWENSLINVKLKKVNRYTKLLKTVMVRVAWRNDSIQYDILTPNILDVIYEVPEDPQEILITKLSQTKRPEDTTYSYWSALEHFILDARGNLLPNPDNTENINPYGLLPFISFFDCDPESDFFLSGGDDLITAQKALNLKCVDLLRNIQLQAWGQPWAKGLGVTKLEFGPETAISLPKDGDFGYAQPQAVIGEVVKAIDYFIKQIAITNSLPSTVFSTEVVSESGIAKWFDTLDLSEARQDDIELYRVYEAKIFETTKRVWNYHNPDNPISESASLSIDFADIALPQSETERLHTAEKKIDMGVWSVVDALMSENPDLKDRKQAIQELELKRIENETYGPLAGILNGGLSNGR